MIGVRRLVLTVLPSVMAVTTAVAQRQPGLTVRVTTRDPPDTVVGLLRHVDPSALAVDSTMVPFAAVSRVEVYRGYAGHGGLGGLIGVLAGFAAGYVIGAKSSERGGMSYAVIGGVIGAPVVGLFGWGVGAGLGGERWDEVPVEKLRRSGAAGPGGSLGIRLAIRF